MKAHRPDPLKHADSYWAATAGDELESVALSGARHVDVAIIGGGFTGLRAALLLAESGASVLLLEAARIGWGASGRNGGQVNPLMPMNSPADIERRLLKTHGDLSAKQAAARMVQATLNSADELFDLIRRYEIPCQARQDGWLRVAHCGRAAEEMRRQCEGWRQVGAEIELLTGADVVQALGSHVYPFGALARRGGCIHPLQYVRGLARRALAAGAVLRAQSPALRLRLKATSGKGNAKRHARINEWEIETPQGRVLAHQVILCTNGYTDQLTPKLAKSIIALTSVQAATRPLGAAVAAAILPAGHTFSDTRRAIFYGRREPDNRLLLGSVGEFGGHGAPVDFRRLRAEAQRIFPGLGELERHDRGGFDWEYRWGGRIAVTADHLPHLHEPAPGLLAGLGYNGRGVAMANVMGRALAERALGKAASTAPFPLSPITTYPFAGLKFFGAPMVLGWRRWLDGVETRLG